MPWRRGNCPRLLPVQAAFVLWRKERRGVCVWHPPEFSAPIYILAQLLHQLYCCQQYWWIFCDRVSRRRYEGRWCSRMNADSGTVVFVHNFFLSFFYSLDVFSLFHRLFFFFNNTELKYICQIFVILYWLKSLWKREYIYLYLLSNIKHSLIDSVPYVLLDSVSCLSLTLSRHVREGYSSCPACLSVTCSDFGDHWQLNAGWGMNLFRTTI